MRFLIIAATLLCVMSASVSAATFVRVRGGNQATDICYGADVGAATSTAFAAGYITSVGGVSAWKPVQNGVVIQQGATVTVTGGTITAAVNPPQADPVMVDASINKTAFQALLAANGNDLAAALAAWPKVGQ